MCLVKNMQGMFKYKYQWYTVQMIGESRWNCIKECDTHT